MRNTTKLVAAVFAVQLGIVVLAACSPAPLPGPAGTSATSTPASDVESTEPDPCPRLSGTFTNGDEWRLTRAQPLKDLGEREFARGEVALDADGNIDTYTVAAGDVEAVIAERLCAYPDLGAMNHVRDIFPGQVLWLNPNPDTPWVPYFNPRNAEAGFAQIPYQDAITAAGLAVDEGDVDGVRAVWNDTLSAMFTDQGTIDAIEQVMEAGDLDAMRQLFS